MRAAPRSRPSVDTDGRRNRLLATVTAVTAATSFAVVLAASSGTDVAATAPPDGEGAVAGSDDGRIPAAAEAGQDPVRPDVDLAPRSGGDSPTQPPIGDIERLSDREDLPRLPGGDAAASTTTSTSSHDEEATTSEPAYETADGEEIDAERVFDFLDGRDAPLAAHAETIVAAGVEHDVDPRVVVAIAIAESNGAERKPTGTHNAWGWGGSGPSGLQAWGSWEEAIDEYTERLGALYDTDDVDWDFASTYCPPNTQWWYDTVTWAIGQI